MRPCSSSTRCCTERSVTCRAITVLLLTTALRDLAWPLTRHYRGQRCWSHSTLGTDQSQGLRTSPLRYGSALFQKPTSDKVWSSAGEFVAALQQGVNGCAVAVSGYGSIYRKSNMGRFPPCPD